MILRPSCSLNLIHIRSMSPQSTLPTVPIASASFISPRLRGFLISSSIFDSTSSILLIAILGQAPRLPRVGWQPERLPYNGVCGLASWVSSFQVIPRQFWVDIHAPGIDPAAQTLYVFKSMALKIGGCVQAACSLMIINDEKIFARPAALNFLHQLLRKQMRMVDLDRVVLFARAHVEQVNLFSARDLRGQVARLDLHGALRFLARDDVLEPLFSSARDDLLEHFVDIEVLIACAHLRECFLGGESATAATADVIFAKQRALRAGKLNQQFAHRDVRLDCRSVHQYLNLKRRAIDSR